MIDTISKYGFEIPSESLEKNIARLTNQMWKLIPMRENEENWEKQLDTVILEIAGLNEVFVKNPQFL
jgi:predicted ATP-dependent Lon-type protease